MFRYVSANEITENNAFPYDFKSWNYPAHLLRSVYYAVWFDSITEDGQEKIAVMDYNGFIEWYNRSASKWKEEDPENYTEFTAEEYLPYHIGRTVDVVKIIDTMKTEDGKEVILNDLLIDGDFIVKDAGTEQIIFDTKTDGGDVPPDLALRPVSWMFVKNGQLTITVK